MTGAELDTVTVLESTEAPSSAPSLGVTVQVTVSSLSKSSPESVSVVTPGSFPLTVQA